MHPDPASFYSQRARLVELARRLGCDSHAAEDVVQEAWIAARISGPGRIRDLPRWLNGVVRFKALRIQQRTSRFESVDLLDGRPEEGLSQLALLAGREEVLQIQAAIAGLREPYRTVLRLRFLEDHSVGDVARAVERPRSTVKCQLRRGLLLLREELGAPESRAPLPALFALSCWSWTKSKGGSPRLAFSSWAGLAAVVVFVVGAALGLAWTIESSANSSPGVVARAASPASWASHGVYPQEMHTEPFRRAAESSFTGRPERPIEERGRTISGRVLGPDRRGRSGVRIFGSRAGASMAQELLALSDDHGSFEFFVEEGDEVGWVEPRAPGLIPQARVVLPAEGLGPSGDELVLRTLSAPPLLVGCVRSGSGHPLGGARVTARAHRRELPRLNGDGQWTLPTLGTSATSDDEGVFRVPLGTRGSPVLLVEALGHRTIEVRPRLDGTPVLVQLELLPTAGASAASAMPEPPVQEGRNGTLLGSLHDPEGRPLEGWRIELRTLAGVPAGLALGQAPDAVARTAADGTFSLGPRCLPSAGSTGRSSEGPRLHAFAPGGGGLAHAVFPFEFGDELGFVLDPAQRPSGSLSGAFLSSASPAGLPQGRLVLRSFALARDLPLEVDRRSGRFQIGGLPAGVYRLFYVRAGLPPVRIAVRRMETGDSRDLGFLAPPPVAWLDVEFRTPSGERIRPDRLHLFGSRLQLTADLENGNPLVHLRPDGRVRLGPLLPEPVSLRAEIDGHADVMERLDLSEGGMHARSLMLVPGVTVELTLDFGGVAPGAIRLGLVRLGDGAEFELSLGFPRAMRLPLRRRLRLAPGTYCLTAREDRSTRPLQVPGQELSPRRALRGDARFVVSDSVQAPIVVTLQLDAPPD